MPETQTIAAAATLLQCYVGASLSSFFSYLSSLIGWDRLESEKRHAQEIASLHLRTIGALALAIKAKDHVTHDHVQRVQTYALAVGKELGLNKTELDALQAASLLHDIGKLAVPEHIISKPGKLSPAEFEKMKIHPIVGAEILERVRFPYPVVPIVRSHHEKWDGKGYPDGLKGEDIPIGARILAAVDCLDALASDRQYRRAYPLDQAMAIVSQESGTSFDPKVVAILQKRYVELEKMACSSADVLEPAKLSTKVKVERGAAPDAGFEHEGALSKESTLTTERVQNLDNALTLPETLSLMATRLKQLVHFDALAVYAVRNQKLAPEYVVGEELLLFSSLEIPVGQGLSGWVAENRKPIVNGNPSVEPGYLNDGTKFSKLSSALAAPLEDAEGVVGVLTLYRNERDAFTREQLRIVQAVTSKLAVAVRNSLN